MIPEHLQRFEWYEPHQNWLRNKGGQRADLRRAYFRDADLSDADLSDADLRRAYFRGADLSDADLSDADLRRAYLSGAVGFHLLTQTEHGYLVTATWRGGEWRIVAGCRDFSIAEARAHWGAADYPLPSSGSRILACLDWLAKQPTPEEPKP